MAPVIHRLRSEPECFETVVCATAQHREMLDSILDTFGIVPDVDLDLMRPDQDLNSLAGDVLRRFDGVLTEVRPDRVVVQGDTTTVLAASIAAFHRRVPVAHVEAGLRTGDLRNPFPEEMNRRVTDLVADLHFAPTERSAAALRGEGIAPQRIHVTGNTVVDALRSVAERMDDGGEEEARMVLVTAHRRESFGAPIRRAFRAIRRLAHMFPDWSFIFPVHPNPAVRGAVELLENEPNVRLVEPAEYTQLVAWLRDCRIVITDSGGIQEEAPTFGKPTLVLRESTERPEGVEAGIALLVGTDEERIVREAERLMTDEEAYARIARRTNPYGDGRAAERIVGILAGRRVQPFGET